MNCKLRNIWKTAGGIVPEYWNFKTIEELLEHPKSISVGVMYPGDDTKNGIPLIKVSDVKNGTIVTRPSFCISKKVDEEYKRTRLNGTELLITLVGNPGDCVVVTNEMFGWNAARALAVVRLKDIELRHWLRYLLLSKPAMHLIDSRLNTTVQKTLNLKDIRELGLPIPPKQEREKITNIINSIDNKITLNRQINQTLEAMAQALFKSWFVDFEPVKAKMAALSAGGNDEDANLAAMSAISGKSAQALLAMQTNHPEQYQQLYATAELFPSEMVESELGEIPKGWEVKQIKDFGQVVCGKTPSKANDAYYGDFMPFIKIPDMHNSIFVVEPTEHLSQEGAKSQHKKTIPAGSVCVSCIATVGNVVVTHEPSQTNQQINSIVPNNKNATYYLYFLMLSLKKKFHDLASGGSATLNMNTSVFSGVKVLSPSNYTIEIFNNSLSSAMNMYLSNMKENVQLALVRDELLPKVLSGELSVVGVSNEA